MIYFDNAATAFPKPPCVIRAVSRAVTQLGGNPGRSGHALSMKAAEAVYSVRERAGNMFGAEPQNVIFTSSCTHSLNIAIKGFCEPRLREGRKTHVIISDHEHNSVRRPVHELSKRGLTYSVAALYPDEEMTVRSFESLITPDTAAIIASLGSNVTGLMLPRQKIGELCRRRGIAFIADGAQVCGVKPVNLSEDNINILCMPGHKGLYGISGTGLLITDGKYHISHIMEGGTGSASESPEQTPLLPDSLESGTLNTAGIVSVGAGMDFISRVSMNAIEERENTLCDFFINAAANIPAVRIYRHSTGNYLPIVLFNVEGSAPEETAAYLNDRGFALRAGLHCSPLAHSAEGTMPLGAVRFSPSFFNTPAQVAGLIRALKYL